MAQTQTTQPVTGLPPEHEAALKATLDGAMAIMADEALVSTVKRLYESAPNPECLVVALTALATGALIAPQGSPYRDHPTACDAVFSIGIQMGQELLCGYKPPEAPQAEAREAVETMGRQEQEKLNLRMGYL